MKRLFILFTPCSSLLLKRLTANASLKCNKKLKHFWLFWAFSLFCSLSNAQTSDYVFYKSDNGIKDKGFYLLTLLESLPDARVLLSKKLALSDFKTRIDLNIQKAKKACSDTQCVVSDLLLSDIEIEKIGTELASLDGGPFKSVLAEHLRKSGAFHRYHQLSNAELIAVAWRDTALGINNIYAVYGIGKLPRFPETDGVRLPINDKRLFQLLMTSLDAVSDGDNRKQLFFESWVQVAFDLLLIHQRTEAEIFEPLTTGQNQAALNEVRNIDWRQYPYSAIVVLGAGLRGQERGLSAIGAMRVRLAVDRYRKKLAPYIVVSGGSVHPANTPFNEAIEMKRELMARFQIPEKAIFIDPHARHTTTNLRNTARILYRSAVPMSIPILITSTGSQIDYIQNSNFNDRCMNELGYLPVTIIQQLSNHDLVAKINLNSLNVDTLDPLDP